VVMWQIPSTSMEATRHPMVFPRQPQIVRSNVINVPRASTATMISSVTSEFIWRLSHSLVPIVTRAFRVKTRSSGISWSRAAVRMVIPTETITKRETLSKANAVRTAVPHSTDEFNPYHYISASLWHLRCHSSSVRPNLCMYIRAIKGDM